MEVPNVLDLLIAVFAAAAATFAMARPNISGAIAGVAIATALVPPVCAVGISLAHGAWLNAFGATVAVFHQPGRHHRDVELHVLVPGDHGIGGSAAPSTSARRSGHAGVWWCCCWCLPDP